MSPSEEYNLEIRIHNEYSPFIRLTLFDTQYRERFANRNESFTIVLPKGIYTLRLELIEQISDITIVLNEDRKYYIHNEPMPGYILIQPPKLYSAMPLHAHDKEIIYQSSHEYYTDPAVAHSTQNTVSVKQGTQCSLFIMLRFLSIERYRESGARRGNFWEDFQVEDLTGNLKLRFTDRGPDKNIVVDASAGYAVFNAELEPGLYFLNYTADLHPRQIPVYVYRDWHTQVFLLMGKQPYFRSLRILFSRTRKFDPYYRQYRLIDILLNKLQYNDFTLTDQIIGQAAREKFESPMLGMLCAYAYLKSKATKNDGLLNMMIHNLKDRILDNNDNAPDLRALEILNAMHSSNASFPRSNIEAPPMFRAGFEAIKEMSVTYPELIRKGSYNDFISVNAYYDCPFNTFRPVKHLVKSASENVVRKMRSGNRNTVVMLGTEKMGMGLSPEMEVRTFLGEKSFAHYISAIGDESEADFTWVENSIVDLLKRNHKMNTSELSRELNLSGNTIARILEQRKQKLG